MKNDIFFHENCRRFLAPACLAATLLLAACSGGGSQATPSSAAPPPTSNSGSNTSPGNNTNAGEDSATTGAPLETRSGNGAGYQPAFPNQTRAPGIRNSIAFDVQTVASGLDSPWAVEVLPDERFLITERPGRLRIIGADGSKSAPVQGLPAVTSQGQGGLLDVALDPQFQSNRIIYWSYAEPRDGGNGTTLARGRLIEDAAGARLENVQVIFRQMPTFQSSLHFGSRIVFAGDGTLFLTVGERSVPAGMVQAQDLRSDFGKVIHLNADGSIPSDNPFVGRADTLPEIWSYGHRNVQAATIDALTGRLWTVEHGPLGGDELNHPEPGRNYGWPIISYGIDYDGTKLGEGITARDGMEQPVYYWDPVIAPSGMIVYRGAMFPQWQGSIFIGGLAGMKLVRLQMDGERVAGEEWLLQERNLRIRDVQQGSDGAIYVLADGPNSSLLRLVPKN
ncbi:MAG: PQQ-dependent sugar dehydrogenase [Nevskiaceae bacterium]|jgi:glucose/arabinose dehydrogenase|nr:PQQ-dependent sugar dehydrogenase [Nevskiaceae bacterium]